MGDGRYTRALDITQTRQLDFISRLYLCMALAVRLMVTELLKSVSLHSVSLTDLNNEHVQCWQVGQLVGSHLLI